MTVYWYDWATLCTDTLLRKCLNYTKFSATVCYHHTVSFFSLDVQLYLYWCIVIGSSKELSIDICWVQVAITIENTKIISHTINFSCSKSLIEAHALSTLNKLSPDNILYYISMHQLNCISDIAFHFSWMIS